MKKQTIYQNLWDAAKAVLRRKFNSNKCLHNKTKQKLINNLTLYLQEPEKGEEHIDPEVSRRKEIKTEEQ